MKICHEESGHLGINKTIAKVVERYWIGIVKDVTSYIKHCQECQHQNKTNYLNMPRNNISASLQKNLA